MKYESGSLLSPAVPGAYTTRKGILAGAAAERLPRAMDLRELSMRHKGNIIGIMILQLRTGRENKRENLLNMLQLQTESLRQTRKSGELKISSICLPQARAILEPFLQPMTDDRLI